MSVVWNFCTMPMFYTLQMHNLGVVTPCGAGSSLHWYLRWMEFRVFGVCLSVLECVEVCWSMMQCVAVWCSVCISAGAGFSLHWYLRCMEFRCCSVWEFVGVYWSALQCIAECCSVLQRVFQQVVTCCSAGSSLHCYLPRERCRMLRRAAACCRALVCVVLWCVVLWCGML